MGRRHWIEFHELSVCPEEVRNSVTDLLQFSIRFNAIFEPAERLLARAVERTRAQRIVDLCSGGGGPWLSIGADVPVRMTDKYPNVSAFSRVQARTHDRVGYEPAPVDATAVPPELDGFRTIFSAFHHFRPAQARAILADSVAQGQGIAVFEFTRRDPLALLSMLLSPLFAICAVPFLRPFRWARLFWTYLVPLIPLVLTLDGIVSCFRTYSVDELRELTRDFTNYDWEIGAVRGARWPVPVTYLIGYPKQPSEVKCAVEEPLPVSLQQE